jgi:L-asparaginase II
VTTNPILVQATRGDMAENVYRGCYAIVDAEGNTIHAVGNIGSKIYPRSSLKSIQALAVVESGAAKEYRLTAEELALACASHNGEERHVTGVRQWLAKLGLSEAALECGVHNPMGREASAQLARLREKPTAAHNACSGKHAGFLTLTQYLKYPTAHYVNLNHPTQVYINRIIADVCEVDVETAPKGIDGCQVPLIGMPVWSLALGMAKLARPRQLKASLKRAAESIVAAMQTHPYLIGGAGRFCTDVIHHTEGKVLVKMGADGVFSGIIPAKGWGIALKIDDGHLKAAEVAMLTLLEQLGVLTVSDKLVNYLRPNIKTWNKDVVGCFEGIKQQWGSTL